MDGASTLPTNDHRNIGTQQELFFFDPCSPGSCFFLPHGTKIRRAMVDYLRDKYWEYEYDEVVTPNMFNLDLWVRSGHAAHYKENLFLLPVDSHEFGLKPMNCPAHCIIFAQRVRSYRELPLRLADFGVLHRNEFSGALSGLTRVRRFQQDDGHIFCRPDQVSCEVLGCLQMLQDIYNTLGLKFRITLSTRPDDSMGTAKQWEVAEVALIKAINQAGLTAENSEKDGAFYGPKIDITVQDAAGRNVQCATIQLDFQLPERFDLQYMSVHQGLERPVIIHRAVFGSIERMFAMLTEHFAGDWPLWLSPRQVAIIPVAHKYVDYAQWVRSVLRGIRLSADVDASDNKMQKKVRAAQIARYNYIAVVGQHEVDTSSVSLRTRDNVVHGSIDIRDVLLPILKREVQNRSIKTPFVKS